MISIDHAYQGRKPLLPILIGVNQPRIYSLAAAGRSIPPPIQGEFLIDTGTDDTFVDVPILQQLQLQPTNPVAVLAGATGRPPVVYDQYNVKVRIEATTQGQRDFVLEAFPVLAGDFSRAGFQGLVGRDLLEYCEARFYGGPQRFSLRFR